LSRDIRDVADTKRQHQTGNGGAEVFTCKCVLKANATLKFALKFACIHIFMTDKEIYSLCEAVADYSYIAAEEKYITQDSREIIDQFIEWATDFEYIDRNIDWSTNSPLDYIDSICHFIIFKINQWRSI
jgi:hypothetical protein